MPTRELRCEHAELVRLSRRLRMHLFTAVPNHPGEFLIDREHFCKVLTNHLINEDWLLYPRLAASPNPRIAETAERFMREMGGLLENVQLWMAIWTPDAITQHWAAFRSETEALLDTLSVRIVRENRELYPLLERIEMEA